MLITEAVRCSVVHSTPIFGTLALPHFSMAEMNGFLWKWPLSCSVINKYVQNLVCFCFVYVFSCASSNLLNDEI